jgi:diaminobutyrate-2-oxoglutarate transaminase
MTELAVQHPATPMNPKGRGLARGLAFDTGDIAGKVCRAAFERGLLMETSGPGDEVVKVMPPLTITDDELAQGLEILADSVRTVCSS